jgi:hypothetical protein
VHGSISASSAPIRFDDENRLAHHASIKEKEDAEQQAGRCNLLPQAARKK